MRLFALGLFLAVLGGCASTPAPLYKDTCSIVQRGPDTAVRGTFACRLETVAPNAL